MCSSVRSFRLDFSSFTARFSVLIFLLSASTTSVFADWVATGDDQEIRGGDELQYLRKSIRRKGDNGFFSGRTIQTVWFDVRNFAFKVIDNGDGEKPKYPNLATALVKNNCLAGCNGGFFLPDYKPSGLMVSDNVKIGKWGTGKLLAGALLVDWSQKAHLQPREEVDHEKATQLVQSGPLLIEAGKKLEGLDKQNPRRRTFAVFDGKEFMAIGLTDSFTLDELADILVQPGLFGDTTITRALNLDGGTSSGLFFDRGPERINVNLEPLKRVRNFIGITQRQVDRKNEPILKAIPIIVSDEEN